MSFVDVERIVRQRGLRIFSPLDLERLAGLSPIAARFLVHRYAKRGLLLKLRNGLYALTDQPPSDLALANRLYEPSYLSLEFALSYYHLIPEAIYRLTSVTTRPTRTVVALEKTFEYHHLKRPAFTGYTPVAIGVETILIATPEKALLDYLYFIFIELTRQPLNERLSLRSLSRSRLETAARVFGHPSLLQRMRRLR